MVDRPRSWLKRYGTAVVFVALALILMLVLDPWLDMTRNPYLLFFGALTVSAWYGGSEAGILATLLSALLSAHFFIDPTHEFEMDFAATVRTIIFVLQGFAIASLCGALRTAEERTKVSLQQLQASETRFRRLVNSNIIGIVSWDIHGAITEANDEFLRMTGFTQEDVRSGRVRWDEMTPPDVKHLDEPALAELLAKGTNTPYEKTFIGKDGNRVPVVVGAALLENGSDGAISFVLDLTRLKQVEKALQKSQAQLQAILDNATILIYVKDLEGRYLLVNRQFEKAFNISQEDFIGKTDYDFFPKEIADAFRDNDKLVLKGNSIELEETAPQKDGIHTYISVKFPLYDTTGKIYASCGISADINERKRTEEALREREQRFSTLFNGMDDWVFVYRVAPDGQPGKIIEVNEQACQKLGYSREELLTMSVADIINSSSLKLKIILEKLVNEKHVVLESVHVTKDGRFIPVEVSATLFTLNGLPTIQSICRDITERKQAEQEREQLLKRERAARKEAEAANRIKDEFLAVLSHELRSPLNPILGWSNLLRTRKFEEDVVDKALETIERNAKLQTQLIEDLLDVSRIMRGKLALNICPVNLREVIEEALETVKLAAETKNIHLQTQLEPEVKPIKGDPSRLQQIVWNLLSNAIKFTPEGGRVEVKLESCKFSVLNSELGDSITQNSTLEGLSPELNSGVYKPRNIQHSQSFAQIQVIDTGKGISPEFLPHVFDYFRQADGTTTRAFGGLGLGLAIVRHLTELHGGTVWAQSLGEGQGATFTVRFPTIIDVAETSQGDRPSTAMFDLSSLRILLVDDEADMRDLVVVILKEYGAKVKVTGSAAEALFVLNQFKPNVLISDIGMPEVDGYTLIRQIRARLSERGEQIRAIALTAYAGEGDRQQALSAGFEMHLAKPIEPHELAKALASLFPSNQS